jgi:hypothetical protein
LLIAASGSSPDSENGLARECLVAGESGCSLSEIHPVNVSTWERVMRQLIALTLALMTTAISAEEWVVLRPPPDTGASPAGVLIDSTSIQILGKGIRRAKVKIDFLSHRKNHEDVGPNAVNFMISVKSYDCEKQLTHEDSMESHQVDGSVRRLDLSKNSTWYPTPANRLADPTIDFVCGWKPK